MAANEEVMEKAHGLVRTAEHLHEQYEAELRRATETLRRSMRLRLDARLVLEENGASVEQMREVLDARS